MIVKTLREQTNNDTHNTLGWTYYVVTVHERVRPINTNSAEVNRKHFLILNK